jgi:LmbE family N-acetylglucosaminyl deacetylase
MRRSTVPDEAITTKVDVRAWTAARFAAMRAHRSQIAETSPLMAIGEVAWADLVGVETFVLREARVPVQLPETDLFGGL